MTIPSIRIALLLGIICGLAWPALGRAQGRPSQLATHLLDEPGLTLGLDVGWDSDRAEQSRVEVIAPTLQATLALTHKLELDLRWPLVFMAASGSIGRSTLLSGNPFAAAYLVTRSSESYSRFGIGLAFPASHLGQRAERIFSLGKGANLEDLAYAYARAMRGMWDAWIYYPDQFTFVVPLQYEAQHGPLLLGADAAAALLVSTDRLVDSGNDVVLQAAGTVGVRTGGIKAGLRVQGVWSPTSDGNAQFSAVPFIQGDFSEGDFLYARVLLNLDGPLGVFQHGAELWGIFVGAGAHI